MDNLFKIGKAYRVPHKILEVLHRDWEANGKSLDRLVGSIKISSDTKIQISDVHQFQYLLVDQGHITIADNDGQSMIALQQNGLSAYIGSKYLKEGRKRYWEPLIEAFKILIPLGALILSIFNYNSNNSNKKEIENVKQQILKFKK